MGRRDDATYCSHADILELLLSKALQTLFLKWISGLSCYQYIFYFFLFECSASNSKIGFGMLWKLFCEKNGWMITLKSFPWYTGYAYDDASPPASRWGGQFRSSEGKFYHSLLALLFRNFHFYATQWPIPHLLLHDQAIRRVEVDQQLSPRDVRFVFQARHRKSVATFP